jgi:predicted nucleic acid-binding protein
MIACQDFQQYSEIINITNQFQVVEQDHDDDMVIECAVLGEANYIVTGDRHLLSMQSYQNIVILKARDFLDYGELF